MRTTDFGPLGREAEEKPVVIDGRNGKALVLDAEISAWAARRDRRGRFGGINLMRAFALVQCRTFTSPSTGQHCPHVMIVARNQRTSRCPRCGRRAWLAGLKPLASSDSRERLHRLIPVFRGSRPPLPMGDIDAHTETTAGTIGGEYPRQKPPGTRAGPG